MYCNDTSVVGDYHKIESLLMAVQSKLYILSGNQEQSMTFSNWQHIAWICVAFLLALLGCLALSAFVFQERIKQLLQLKMQTNNYEMFAMELDDMQDFTSGTVKVGVDADDDDVDIIDVADGGSNDNDNE
jgi:hypothetical protein